MCPASAELTVSMGHQIYVTLCRRPSGMQFGIPICIPDGRPHRVTYTRFRIDTVSNCPDDGHIVARNM